MNLKQTLFLGVAIGMATGSVTWAQDAAPGLTAPTQPGRAPPASSQPPPLPTAPTPTASVPTSPTPTVPAAARTLQEVIVTARRRAEDLQKVPVEISVVTSPEIRALNIISPEDISNDVSGLQVDPGQSVDGAKRNADFRYSIRGQEGGTGVVVYVDDVPNFPSNVFDLSNIQVLKGPQGTLFGDVTTGGAVLLQPTLRQTPSTASPTFATAVTSVRMSSSGWVDRSSPMCFPFGLRA